MTTRRAAEAVLFDVKTTKANSPQSKRRRVEATYCPRCGGWVEVRLAPICLRCVRCGLEARP